MSSDQILTLQNRVDTLRLNLKNLRDRAAQMKSDLDFPHNAQDLLARNAIQLELAEKQVATLREEKSKILERTNSGVLRDKLCVLNGSIEHRKAELQTALAELEAAQKTAPTLDKLAKLQDQLQKLPQAELQELISQLVQSGGLPNGEAKTNP